MVEIVGCDKGLRADRPADQQQLVGAGIRPGLEHRAVGLVLVDGAQLPPQQPYRRIEPLQAAGQIGKEQVPRMVQPHMGPFMQQDRRDLFGRLRLREHDIPAPAEGGDRLRRAHQHHPVRQAFAAPAADHPHDGRKRPRHAACGRQHPGKIEPAEKRRPREGCRGRHRGGSRPHLRRMDPYFIRYGDLAADGDDAQRQEEREHQQCQHDKAVQAAEGLAPEQQPEEEPRHGQTGRHAPRIGQQGFHGQRVRLFSMRSIRARSSSTEIFSSSTSADTAPR